MYLHYAMLAIIRLLQIAAVGFVSLVVSLFAQPVYVRFYVSKEDGSPLAVSVFSGPPGMSAYIGRHGILGRIKISWWIYQIRCVAWFVQISGHLQSFGLYHPVPCIITKQEGEIFDLGGKVGRCFQVWETDESDAFHTEPAAKFFRYALVKPWCKKYAWNIQLGWPMVGGRYDGSIVFKINPFHVVK